MKIKFDNVTAKTAFLNCLFRIAVWHQAVIDSVNDHHVSVICADSAINIQIINCFHILRTHSSYRHLSSVFRNIICGIIHFPGIIRNTKRRINQDHSSHIIFSVCSSQSTYKSSLALSQKEKMILIHIILCFHKVHNST